jgi:hypothetical protein
MPLWERQTTHLKSKVSATHTHTHTHVHTCVRVESITTPKKKGIQRKT